MNDAENTPVTEVAPQANETQNEQVASTENEATPPQAAEATEERLYAGKYKSVEEMERAYAESQSKMTQLAQEKAELEKMSRPVEEFTPAAPDDLFDETTTQGVMSLAEKAWERKEAEKWVKQNAGDLKDPIVDSRTKDLIRRGYDRDAALSQAKMELSERVTPVQKEALAQGVKEGQELANEKAKMGAIGTAGTSGKVDESTLSSAELAKLYGIPRI